MERVLPEDSNKNKSMNCRRERAAAPPGGACYWPRAAAGMLNRLSEVLSDKVTHWGEMLTFRAALRMQWRPIDAGQVLRQRRGRSALGRLVAAGGAALEALAAAGKVVGVAILAVPVALAE